MFSARLIENKNLKDKHLMSDKKNLYYGIVSNIFNFAIGLVVSFYVTSVIVKQISEAAYGFVGLANDFIGYAQILTIALNSMAGRFISVEIHKNNLDSANRYYSSVLYMNIIIFSVLTALLGIVIVFIDRLVNVPVNLLMSVRLLWGLLFINFLVSILTGIFQVSTFVKDKLYLTATANIAGNMIRLFTLIVTFGFWSPKIWFIGLSVLLSSVFSLSAHYKFNKQLLPELTMNRDYFDLKSILILLKAGAWNSLTRLGGILSTGLDLLLTNRLVGAAAMGLVSVSRTVPGIILQFMSMVGSVFAPRLTRSFAKNNISSMAEQIKSSMKVLGLFSGIPMAFLFIFGADFFSLWMPSLDENLLHRLSMLACLAFTFSMPMESIWNVFIATNKVKVTSIYLFINSVVSIGIVLFLLTFKGDVNVQLYIIVGVSSVFSTIRALVFLPLYAAHCLKISWFSLYPAIMKNTIYTGLLTLVAFTLRLLISSQSWKTLIVTGFVLLVISLIIGSFFLFDMNERQEAINMILRRDRNAKNT